MEQALVRGVQDVGDQMFTESQRIVNVDRGTLKKSGFIRYLRDGVEFGYRTPYARRVNSGVAADYWEAVRRHVVRSHRRRLPAAKRYVRVRQHMRGPFKRLIKRREGSQFMEKSIEKIRPQIGRIILRRLKAELH